MAATRPAAGLRGMLAVEQGERSSAVAAVRQRPAANRLCVAVDGEFGARTRRALGSSGRIRSQARC